MGSKCFERISELFAFPGTAGRDIISTVTPPRRVDPGHRHSELAMEDGPFQRSFALAAMRF